MTWYEFLNYTDELAEQGDWRFKLFCIIFALGLIGIVLLIVWIKDVFK